MIDERDIKLNFNINLVHGTNWCTLQAMKNDNQILQDV